MPHHPNSKHLCCSRAYFLIFLTFFAQMCKYADCASGNVTNNVKNTLIYDLPRNCFPTLYEIELIPFLSEASGFIFEGNETISITCAKPTFEIVLHAKDLIVEARHISILMEDAKEGIRLLEKSENLLTDHLTLRFAEELVPGNYYLHLKFVGKLGDLMRGFYKSSYVDKKTQKKVWLATTQFQPSDARRAFPCFDEPHLKAQFEIRIASESHMTTLSNMPITKSVPIRDDKRLEGWKMNFHARSVPMSTYLVAFIVSDFPFRTNLENGTTKSNRMKGSHLHEVTFRVWAPPNEIGQGMLALESGPKYLNFYEEYFGVVFPMPKQDMIAIPDFPTPGMENWGLITFRETCLLYDPSKSSTMSKRVVLHTISHEMAHQWFGNLVTPARWDDLWLNEGFADYMAYVSMQYINPDMMPIEFFVMDDIYSAMEFDALDSSHTIRTQFVDPSDIKDLFDIISFKKGAAIIRMMGHFITENTLRLGLARYLSKWRYKSTTQDDLWRSLTEQAQLDGTIMKNVTVQEVMETWIDQQGFPVVSFKRHYSISTITVKQTKFSYTNLNNNDGGSWWIPISYATNSHNSIFNDTRADFWLPKNQTTMTFEVKAAPNDWFVANVELTGFYRVNYDVRNWKVIIHQLKINHRVIPPVNRAQLLNDAIHLARARMLRYEIAFDLSLYLRNDEQVLPWDAFLNGITDLYAMVRQTDIFVYMKKYLWDLLEVQYARMGYHVPMDFTSLQKVHHRSNILKWCGLIEWPDCIQRSLSWFGKWIQSPEMNPIPKSLQVSTYCTAMRYGGVDEWDFAWERFLFTDVAHERHALMTALTCTTSPWLLQRLIQNVIQPQYHIRKQDSFEIYKQVAQNPIGSRLMLEYLEIDWTRLMKYFGGKESIAFGNVFKAIGAAVDDDFSLQKMSHLKSQLSKKDDWMERDLDQAIEMISINKNWKINSIGSIATWLRNYTAKMESAGRKYLNDAPDEIVQSDNIHDIDT